MSEHEHKPVKWQIDRAAHDPKARVVATIEGFAVFKTQEGRFWAVKGDFKGDMFVVSDGFEIPWSRGDKLSLDKQKLLTKKVNDVLRKRELRRVELEKTIKRSRLSGDE